MHDSVLNKANTKLRALTMSQAMQAVEPCVAAIEPAEHFVQEVCVSIAV